MWTPELAAVYNIAKPDDLWDLTPREWRLIVSDYARRAREHDGA